MKTGKTSILTLLAATLLIATGAPMAHLILTVTDAAATAAAVRKAGGTIPREPFPYLDTGIVIDFAADPDGNQIELIQPVQ